VFRYRLHSPDGDDLGEATYAMMIKPGEEIHLGAGRRFRVLDVVMFDDEDDPPSGCYRSRRLRSARASRRANRGRQAPGRGNQGHLRPMAATDAVGLRPYRRPRRSPLFD
jgi:hypothetical protein